MTDELDLPPYAHPSVLIGLAVDRWGARGLMDRCVHLYREMDWGDEPELMSFLAGAKGDRWVELGFGRPELLRADLGASGHVVRLGSVRINDGDRGARR